MTKIANAHRVDQRNRNNPDGYSKRSVSPIITPGLLMINLPKHLLMINMSERLTQRLPKTGWS